VIIATVVQSQTFTSTPTILPTTTNGQIYAFTFSGITGFYFNLYIYLPINYGTFYYSGVGPYHEYDSNLAQTPLPLYEDLTSSMHFEEYGFDVQVAAKASLQMGFGGTSAGLWPYYTLSLNAELDVLKLVPYKQIFFFTRPWDIGEPAGQGPNMQGEGEDDSGSGSDDSLGSWDDSADASWDDSFDDSTDASWDDSWGSLDDSLDGESARLRQDDSSASWDDSYGSYDDSYDSSYDDSWDTSIDDSWGSTDGSSSTDDSLAGSEEGQGFHMYIGGAYDLEVGKFFVSYCEGAYTGSASIWTLISSSTYWTNNYAPVGSTQMMGDCWMDPELVIELNDMLPKSIAKMLGEVEIFEAKLF